MLKNQNILNTPSVYTVKAGLFYYIGYSRQTEKRFQSHFNALKAKRHSNTSLQKLFNEGIPITFSVYRYTESEKMAKELERSLILSNIYSPLCLNKVIDLPTFRKSGVENPFFNKKHTEETLESLRNRKFTSEHKAKISNKKKKYYRELSPQEKETIYEKSSEGLKKFYISPKGEKQKKRFSQRYKGGGNPNSKPLEFDGLIFDCLDDCVKYTGLSEPTLRKYLRQGVKDLLSLSSKTKSYLKCRVDF